MRGSAELCNKIQRLLLPNEVQRNQLKPGDHIWTWRQAKLKHHGIYVGDRKVIHLTRAAGSNHRLCPTCADDQPRALDVHGVVSTSLEDFLSGGGLFLFEYGVNPALFLAKFWELGTCTLASFDPSEIVVKRASSLLNNGSADYYRYINNSEDFAIYCKTGLLVVDFIDVSRILQISFLFAVTVAVYLSQQQITAANFTGLAARYVGAYCICRLAPDIGARPNVIKVDHLAQVDEILASSARHNVIKVDQVQRLPQVDEILASGSGSRVDQEEGSPQVNKTLGPDVSGYDLVHYLIDGFLTFVICGFTLFIVLSLLLGTHQLLSEILQRVWIVASIIFFDCAILQRRLLSNKIQKEQLKPGDHIYTYRRAYTYSHHGIYIGNGKVIYLDRGEDPISGGGEPTKYHVESCCINCFLAGGELHLYKYGVSRAFFIAKTRGATCTTCIPISPSLKLARCRANLPKLARCRAILLLKHKDFGPYNLFNNNSEDFAVYCKTGLLSRRKVINYGMNMEIAFLFAVLFPIIFLPERFPTTNYIDVAAMVYFIYSMFRIFVDNTERGEANRVPLYELANEFQTRSDDHIRQMSTERLVFGFYIVIAICLNYKTVILCFQKLKVVQQAVVQIMQCVLSAY